MQFQFLQLGPKKSSALFISDGNILLMVVYLSQQKVPFLGQGSYHLDQDSKILDQHCKNALDILARVQDAVLNMASFAISSPRDL